MIKYVPIPIKDIKRSEKDLFDDDYAIFFFFFFFSFSL